ncbi:hypothetical protein DOTSEDRAFT_74018 [Dothistroma septosporum NZE10]|uniref:Uncharacterized protein n=1 Tax=Dothistroma septosporum (strain NZE10 / CBS 128990) TaxID=675120 RepID=N1PJT6_DOTSN|nr:hypothetical protein DOTSEDRAFT_74018 [Dothistroma septosporum NZE10]
MCSAVHDSGEAQPQSLGQRLSSQNNTHQPLTSLITAFKLSQARETAFAEDSSRSWRSLGRHAITAMPMPEHFQRSQGHHYCPPPAYQQRMQPLRTPQHYRQSYARPAYDYKPLPPPPQFQQEQLPVTPPRPSKTPVETMVRQPPPGKIRSRSHADLQASALTPDPLLPHSNAQALTQTQNIAFQESAARAPVRVGKEDVYDSQTGFALFVITREAAHVPSFLSSKPLITVMRVNGTTMGTVRFHSITTSSIDLICDGHPTRISHSGLLHNGWGFQPASCPGEKERWRWTSDRATKSAKLVDSKKDGQVLARMKGDLLTYEEGRLSSESYNEVLLSAIAMAEAARRAKRNGDLVDLGSAIGDFVSPKVDSELGGIIVE